MSEDLKLDIEISIEKIEQAQPEIDVPVITLSKEQLEQKEQELLGDSFVLPTLEDENITFQLGDKEGPLDVLLEMIKTTKLDIMEVRLADLTEQFIQYMSALKNVNMEQQSEFIVVASMLLEIKSRNLLPVEEEEAEIDEEDPEALLKRRLQLYKLFKDASLELANIENVGHFYKAPDKTANDFKIVLKDMNMQGLIDAFSKLLLVVEKREIGESNERQIKKDRFTVADSIVNMKCMLTQHKKIRFNDFFGSDFSRSEIINTFLAMLELLKSQFASVEQSNMFGEINITIKEGGNNEERQEEVIEYN